MADLEKIPIVNMEATTNEDDVSKVIVRLPYCDIADIVSWVVEWKPLAIIPPYNGEVQFVARAASMVRDRLPEQNIMCAIRSTRPSTARHFLQTLQEGAFRIFALDRNIGEIPLEHLFPVMPEGLWLHVAGGKPKAEGLVGKWTWSEEGL